MTTLLKKINLNLEIVYATCSPNGRYLAVLGTDESVRLYDISGNIVLKRREERVSKFYSPVAFSSDSAILVIGRSGGQIIFIGTSDGRYIEDYVALGGNTSLSFSSNGYILAIGQTNGCVKLLDLKPPCYSKGKFFDVCKITHPIVDVMITSDNQTLIFMSDQNEMYIYQIESLSDPVLINHHQLETGYKLLDISPDKKYAVIRLPGRSLGIIDLVSGEVKEHLGGEFLDSIYLANGLHLALKIIDEGELILLEDVASGSELRRFNHHGEDAGRIRLMRFQRPGQQILIQRRINEYYSSRYYLELHRIMAAGIGHLTKSAGKR